MFSSIMYFMLWFPLRVMRLFWWRWSIEGLENLQRGQGMVLAINHLHWLDIFIIGASLPFSYRPTWLAKVEIFINWLAARWFHAMLVIPIRRGQRDMGALAAAEQALNRGALLVIFPEGHRSHTGGLQEGHGGAVRLAARAQCPIVPIAVWGTEVGLTGAMLRKPLHFRVGKPYYVTMEGHKIPWDRMNELTEEMMLRIAALMPEQYWGVYRDRMLEMNQERIA